MTAVDIRVRGVHTVTMPPERATVHAVLSLEGPQPEPVFQAVSSTLADVKASIEALHHPKRGPVTWYSFDQVRVTARRPWNSEGAQLPLVHSAAVPITATFADFDELATWVSWGVGLDGVGIGHIEWDLTGAKRAKTERAARQKAVRDAQQRAQDYADALDLGPVAVRSISDPSTGAVTPMARATLAAQSMSGGGGTPEFALRPDDVEITAVVEAGFIVLRKR